MAEQDVTVYNSGGSFINDMGKTVLPAAIKPIDFTSLDKALEMERDLSEKALSVVAENVKGIGAIQDELTGIQTPSAFHAMQLEDAKKEHEIDKEAFLQAANNIDNPMALYTLKRKSNKLAMDPRVKNIMYENAIVDNFKANIPTITDPYLRLRAIADLKAMESDTTGTAVKKLNLDQYKEIDLEGAYLAALDYYAPYVTTEEMVYENGVSHAVKTTQRDTEALARARHYFMQNPLAKNNLIARGYIDAKTGQPTPINGEKTWFDDFESAQSAPSTSISNVKGATGKAGGGTYQYTVPTDFKGASYTPHVVQNEDYGTSFDLGVIKNRETSGRHPDLVVHPDAGVGKNLNIGAYSFNGATGTKFLEYVGENAKRTVGGEADLALSEMKGISLTNKDNLDKAKAAYAKLEKALPPGELQRLEDEYAIQQFATPILDYIRTKEEDRPFTTGEATLLMDIGIQWKEATWKKWLTEYYKDESGLSLMEFLTKKRIEETSTNANKGFYEGGAATADSMNTGALRSLEAAMRLDGESGVATGAQSQSAGQAPVTNSSLMFDPSMFGSVEEGVQMAADSVKTAQAGNWGLQ